MRVLIAGGGIGGLTTAIALRHQGVDVLVLEQAKELSEIGAGIQIAANAAIVLRELGLETAIRSVGVKPQSYDYRDLRSGKMLYQAPLGDEAARRYGAPMYNIHRADLVQILSDAVPAESKRLGARCVAVSQDARGVEAKLANGETVRGDLLVGCDGIHSVVRQHLRGQEQKHFANILMWRSLIPAERLEGLNLEERGNYWFGPGRTLITYWVRPKNLYSILASVPAQEVTRESWDESGDISEMLRSFEDAEPRARKMLEQCQSAFITGMYYRDPIDSWSSGRITLLGDAAHPMVPFLAAGAGQSIEDAWTLARVLSRRQDDVPGALKEYEQRRLPRTTRIQAGARAVVKLMHETEANRIRDRNGRWKGMARIDPFAETSWGLAWDYDVVKATEGAPGEVLNVTGLREGKCLRRPESQRAFDLWKFAFRPEDVARGHDGLREAYDRFLTTNFPLPAGTIAVEDELGDVKAWRVAAPNAPRGNVVLHFHGGGYLIGSAKGSLEYASRLAAAVDGVCYTVDYRLAPEHPYPAAIDDAVAAYRALLARGVAASSILVSGESAGGGMAVALVLALRNAGDPLPAAILSVAPFADLTLSGPTIRAFNGDDPAANRDLLTFMGASYFQAHEPTDPLVSPLFGDLTGLPPLFVTASQGEVLLSDATRLAERAERAGLDVTLRIVEDSVHVYPIFPFLPETQTTMQELAVWARRNLRRNDMKSAAAE
ncbi:salicylate hydroxylase [Bradyrhizobium japonicum]|uniref:Salicylate hydroxylase n=1 Tax=Bradyrhizobium elkanii TaxID=29448 RepID=A0ABV4EX09_BRAEL|nr:MULTISPECIES: alpha/beta hydrolase fold domain-containing protein [Bradyrhizobium]MBP2427795.1 salicylate hydroxylase [Bradyrhizobium elkanii]MCP1729981.1 salicylate hydroxylase [Bradyrhizobium elkanii]MCP1756721.1 salicylate hydroxylase [Bradyrhizobium elkanii]MCP1930436.1 salicylate hydroxylase [Bradyrhizobium elkanii]MCP1970993.1 salicylate hydroxylase [Bradyrhizobium elkanii]